MAGLRETIGSLNDEHLCQGVRSWKPELRTMFGGGRSFQENLLQSLMEVDGK